MGIKSSRTTPSPLRGEGWGEGDMGRINDVLTNRVLANPPVNVYTDGVTRLGAFYQVIVTNQ